jgi:hypothetical protein
MKPMEAIDGCEKQPSLSMFKFYISQAIDKISLSTCHKSLTIAKFWT